jgi:hypothetical protein
MKLPDEIRKRFARHGRDGGRIRAARMTAAGRQAVARQAAAARWIRARFGARRFADTGLPGGEIIDAGIADLATGSATVSSLLVSLAAPRLRREGVPLGEVHREPENRLYLLLARSAGDLAHARYNALLRQVVSFADACWMVRRRQSQRAP